MASIDDQLYKSALKFLVPLDLPQTYKTVVSEAIELVHATDGSIFLAKRGTLTRVYTTNPGMNKIVPRKQGYTYSVYKKKKILTLTKEDILRVHPEIGKVDVKANILIPLINRNRSIGVMSLVTSKKPTFSEKDKQVLKLFSPLVSLAIRKAQLYAEVHKAIETRDLFLSLASHELKTPITTIYIYLQLIKRNLNKKRKFDPDWINTLLEEMVRLTKIIDELLELSRIRTGKLTYNFTQSDVQLIIEKALIGFKATHPKQRINLSNRLIDGTYVIGDFDKLIEVVANILDNAAKHSSAESPIEVDLFKKKGFINVRITDKGRGISQSELKKVFTGFFKTSNNTKPGMGLGLYLSKKIVDSHKGKILIKSALEKGTSVQVLLPIPKEDFIT